MELTLKRRYLGASYTIGSLLINGAYFCDTLEDTVRDVNRNGKFDGQETKVAGQTAIPYGSFRVNVTRSPRFKRELPRLCDVPSFEGVLIHRGNTDADTAGCILVGENKAKGKVLNSTKYELELTRRCKAAIAAGEKITITVV